MNLIQSLGRTQLTRTESIKYTNKHSVSKFRNGFENILNLKQFSQGKRASVITALLHLSCFSRPVSVIFSSSSGMSEGLSIREILQPCFLLVGGDSGVFQKASLLLRMCSLEGPSLEKTSNLFSPSGMLTVTARCSILLIKRSHFTGSGTSPEGSYLS